MSQTKSRIVDLAADENRVIRELSFSSACKNTGRLHAYKFEYPQHQHARAITEIFVWAVYKRRHIVGKSSIDSLRTLFWKFLRFLDEVEVSKPEQLSAKTLSSFALWLKNQQGLTYSTAASQYRALAPVFTQMSKHQKISDDFLPVRNAFPKSSSLQSADPGYDQIELRSIAQAAVKGMRETMAKFNRTYSPRWIGKPAPLNDVAPKTKNGGRSLWASEEYKIWWWENNCNCQRLNSTELSKLPKGQSFIASFATSRKTGMVGVEKFYSNIGAGDRYLPRYQGKDCPVKFRTPWKKIDYLVWYWENNIGCAVLSDAQMEERAPELYKALKEHFDGKIGWFYERLGIHRWISACDLVPFYLMLLIRTQLNPSTVQQLTVDCITPDPVNPARKLFCYVKYRSSKKGHTIPANATQEGWPVSIASKLLKITAPFRLPNQAELWIANANRFKKTLPLGSSGFKRGLQIFSRKYRIQHTSGKPLSIQAKLIRPTMAWQEYLRTEDMNYLQVLLGHERIGTTADYLRRVGDPVLKMRRAIHQEAMFQGLANGTSGEPLGEPIPVDGLLNHCSDPFNSPAAGSRKGSLCNARHEVCLGCQNLVITLADIKKYFCFMNYHGQLLDTGVISEEEHHNATGEKKFIWEKYILTRYDHQLISSIRRDAELNPLEIWSTTSEGSWL